MNELIMMATRVNQNQHKKLKMYAAMNEETIQDIINRLIFSYIKENEVKAEQQQLIKRG